MAACEVTVAFVYPSTVRFAEVDGASIAYFSRIFEHCHAAYEEMLAASGLPLRGILEREDWVLPLVHAEADFRRPLRLGDRLSVELRLERLGGSSATFAYRLVGEAGDLRAEARLVHAFIDKATFTPREPPESFLAAMARLGLLP